MFKKKVKKTIGIWHIWDVHPESSGLTNAVLTRASILSQEYNVIIITKVPFSYGYGAVKELYKKKLDKRVKVVNIYSKDLYSHCKHVIKDTVTWTDTNEGYVRGDLKYKILRRGYDDVISEYDEKGMLVSKKYLDKAGGIRYDELIDEEGFVFKRKFYSNSSDPDYIAFYEKNKKYASMVTKYDGHKTTVFDTLNKFYEYRLSEYISQFDLKVLISEYALDMSVLENVAAKQKIEIIYQWHNTCYLKPFTRGSEIAPEQRNFFNNKENVKKMVVLTNEQKEDLIYDNLMDEDKIHVIGNVVNSSVKLDILKREKVCVYLGRIDEASKNISGALTIAKELKEVVNFEFYGDGPDRNYFMGLEHQNVSFLGMSSPERVYSKSLIAIFTSNKEGQSISLMEAMKLGCIPVAYDFKYGPKDYIIDGYNGFIIKNGDVDSFVKKIKILLEDEKLCTQISKNCIKHSEKFDSNYLLKGWVNIIE